jgi:RNA polymerase sigma factor for flagellar operon FliA
MDSPQSQSIDVTRLRQEHLLKTASPAGTDPIPDEVIEEQMPLIRSLAAKVVNRKQLPQGIEEADVISWGIEGLLKAHRSYKPAKGSRFSTYAYYRIKGEIFDKVRQEWGYRNPTSYQEYRKNIQDRIADFLDTAMQNGDACTATQMTEYMHSVISNSGMVGLMSLDGLEEAGNGLDTLVAEPTSDDLSEFPPDQLWEVVSQLEDDEQHIIRLLYIEDKTQREVANVLNYSNSKLCRVHLKILEKIKRRLTKA